MINFKAKIMFIKFINYPLINKIFILIIRFELMFI